MAAVGLSGAGVATAAPQELVVAEHAVTDAVTGGVGAFANREGDMPLSPIGTDGTAFRFTHRLL